MFASRQFQPIVVLSYMVQIGSDGENARKKQLPSKTQF
jgi:hypothetical protein